MTQPRSPFAQLAAILTALLLPHAPASAQDIPEFHKLRTPTSPAFVILGITPAEVERPTAPAAFAASFFQRVEEATKGFPNSYALELAPYWLRSHPGLTFTEYQKPTLRSFY